MNIVHFSYHDVSGGAAKAAYRLHNALRTAGHASKMIVRHKHSDDRDVIPVVGRRYLDLWQGAVGRFFPARRRGAYRDFNPDLDPATMLEPALSAIGEQVDVLCLHWITGLLSAGNIATLARRYRCPIVWMLTDQEPYTGGCHYTYECTGYQRQCGRCPQLESNHAGDRSHIVWNHKSQYLASLPITFVSSCSWTSERFRESSLFRKHRLEEIGDALDISVFRPFDKRAARDLLHIPMDAKVIFFGAYSLDYPRKGMTYLAEALSRLPAQLPAQTTNVFLLCAGNNPHALLNGLPYPNLCLGYLKDDLTLALAYQASDVFVCPSVYEAGAMMVPEAMLCGSPVVAFDTGNAPDLIRTMETGYRAVNKDSSDLANGICAILCAPNLGAMGEAACKTARKRHAPEIVAAQQSTLFKALQAERTHEEKHTHVS